LAEVLADFMVLDATDCTVCCTRHSHFNTRVDARRPLSVTVFTFDPPFILPCILDPKDYYRVYLAAQDPSIRARYRETQTAARRVPAHCSTNAGARRSNMLGQLSSGHTPHGRRLGFATTEASAQSACTIANEKELEIASTIHDGDGDVVTLRFARSNRCLSSFYRQHGGKNFEGLGRQ
jgi:hypothetical protein